MTGIIKTNGIFGTLLRVECIFFAVELPKKEVERAKRRVEKKRLKNCGENGKIRVSPR